MHLPIRPLPVLEQWDCHGCGVCCRGNLIRLDADDLARIQSQNWNEAAGYQGVKVIVRHGLLAPSYTLAQRPDGTCVFLTADGLCRVHQLHGYDAKPRVCKTFPLQIVPLDKVALLTTRRGCPSAAGNKGRPLVEHAETVEKLVGPQLDGASATSPPPIAPGVSRDWADARRVTDVLQGFMLDRRFPLVRRLIHGLQFCDLLSNCPRGRLRKLEAKPVAELIGLLGGSASEDAGHWFGERVAPAKWAAVLFRQAGGEYLRPHPRAIVSHGWRERARVASVAWALARGRGELPAMITGFRAQTFAELDEPLGPLPPAAIAPLDGYFESLVASWRFAALGYRGWSLVDGFRAAALSFAVALWMLRWACGPGGAADSENQSQREQALKDEVIPIIGGLDRSQGYPPLTGARHRRRVRTLAGEGQLQRLVAWYAR